MKIKNLIISILIANNVSCQKKNDSKINEQDEMIKNENVIKNDGLIKTLTKQIEAGNDQTYGAFLDYDKNDLDVSIKIIDTLLKNNGYKKVSNEIFSKKIKAIFNRTIDQTSDIPYLKIDTYSDNVCDKKIKYYPLSVDAQYLYVAKLYNFVTYFYPLPEIMDYQKLYPQVKKSEEKDIIIDDKIENIKVRASQWKDHSDLTEQRKKNIQTLVARNMYLFNDSRAYFKWLILNDKYFMQSLVTTFGYYEDKELLKWVVENTKFDKDNPKDLDQIFWNKKCDGTVKLNLGIFPVLKEIIIPEDVKYFEALKAYTMYLLEEKNKRNKLSLQDRSKLLAHLVYFGEQYCYDNNYNDQSFFMQRIYLFDLDGSIEKEIERNNFYNLPNYTNLYKKSEKYRGELVDENGG